MPPKKVSNTPKKSSSKKTVSQSNVTSGNSLSGLLDLSQFPSNESSESTRLRIFGFGSLKTLNQRPHHNRIYLAPHDMSRLNLTPGQPLTLSSPQSTCIGLAWVDTSVPCEYAGIPEALQSCLGLDDDDMIQLKPAALPIFDAHEIKVTVQTTSQDEPVFSSMNLIFLKEIFLDLRYLVAGQTIPLSITKLATNISVAQLLSDVSDKLQVCRVSRKTKITVLRSSFTPKADQPLQQNIGGLDSQVSEILSMINLCFYPPPRFSSTKLKPPRGALLFGPPGTGKSLLAHHIVSRSEMQGVYTLKVNGSDLISRYYGETEQKLTNLFSDARSNQPSIIIFDEIDIICPSREKTDSDLSRRTVATLLMLMDGATSDAERIFVLGVTNRPGDMDDALRRPGRFDSEIEIPIPDPAQRCKILGSLTVDVPKAITLKGLNKIANQAHGFVGSDLASLCREAGLHAIKRLSLTKPVKQVTQDVCIDLQDFEVALKFVSPSSMREVLVEVPNVLWTDIGGQEEVKQKLKEAVEWPLRNPEAFQRFHIRPSKGVLLYGPPGCSKTLTAKALATEAGLNFLAVKGPELFSKWVGESEKAVQSLFKKARAAAPSIIFFDEIDALAVRRGNEENSVADRVLSQLLSEMDGIEPLASVTILAATNRPDLLDSALLRPGRIDSILYVSPPDLASRQKIFEIRFQQMVVAENVHSRELAEKSEGFSGAEVVAICQKAAMHAIERDLRTCCVDQTDFDYAFANTSKRITPDMIQFYADFKNRTDLRVI